MRINPELRLIIILVLTPFCIAFIHAMLSRVQRLFSRAVSRHVVVLTAIALGHIPVFLAAWFFSLSVMAESKNIITAIAYSIVVYECLAYSYFHVFNMSETARRIKILLEIYKSKGLKPSGLSVTYNSEEMLSNRLKRLVDMRQVRAADGRYFLNSKVLYHAAVLISLWGRLLGLPSPADIYRKKRP